MKRELWLVAPINVNNTLPSFCDAWNQQFHTTKAEAHLTWSKIPRPLRSYYGKFRVEAQIINEDP